MLEILITLKCDDCGGLFEELRSSRGTDLDDWVLRAGNLNETAALAGWFFNAKTDKHWCIECLEPMHPNVRVLEPQRAWDQGRLSLCYE